MKITMIFVSLVVMLGASEVCAQEWQKPVKVHSGHRTRIEATGHTPDGETMTALDVQCFPGKKTLILFNYGIRESEKIKDFNFGDFAGPDAVAMKKKLVTVKLQSSKGNIVMNTSVTGGLTDGDDPDNFQFTFGASLNSRNEVTRLVDALTQGAKSISIRVRSYRDSRKVLYTEFPPTNAPNAIKEMLEGCGKR